MRPSPIKWLFVIQSLGFGRLIISKFGVDKMKEKMKVANDFYKRIVEPQFKPKKVKRRKIEV